MLVWSMARPSILLFDLDGTLCDTGGAGRRAMERAFGEVTGRADACNGFRYGGMTDRLIVRWGLRAIGHDEDERSIDAVLDAYLPILEEEIVRSTGCRVYPGIPEALDACEAASHVALGLGTGNLRRGAEIKLERVGLGGRFGFGGFGCDDEDRVALLRAGARRGAAVLGVRPEEARVVVIGDTPRDVSAAGGIGAECIAVATGGFSVADLRAAGATRVYPNLTALGAIDAILGRAA